MKESTERPDPVRGTGEMEGYTFHRSDVYNCWIVKYEERTIGRYKTLEEASRAIRFMKHSSP